MEEMISIRERLYDLAQRLSFTDPDASHKAMDLYQDMLELTRKMDMEDK